jgi:hypothetical protein
MLLPSQPLWRFSVESRNNVRQIGLESRSKSDGQYKHVVDVATSAATRALVADDDDHDGSTIQYDHVQVPYDRSKCIHVMHHLVVSMVGFSIRSWPI